MNKKSKVIFCAFCIALFVVIAIDCVITHLVSNAFSREIALSRMNQDWGEISLVTDFLINAEQDMINLNQGYGDKKDELETNDKDFLMSAGNEEVYNAAKCLILNRGYSVINKYYGTIVFVMWTRFFDVGKGIAYSVDGSKPDISYLTKLEALDRPGWYYYESDFNEWRLQNNQ